MFGFGKRDKSVAPDDERTAAPETLAQTEEPRAGFLTRLRDRLGKTRQAFASGLGDLFRGRSSLDEDLLEELETQLLVADLGVQATTQVLDALRARPELKRNATPEQLQRALYDILRDLLTPCEAPLLPQITSQLEQGKPYVLLVVGVNGAGKTTTIGKLAHRLQAEGRSVLLAAGDTFRAAAIEQLQTWGERNHVPVIAQQAGADSASVIFDAVESAKARGVDVVIADTAGRLHTQAHLMEELKKVLRVIRKLDANAPHEILLVLDATTGQNALHQAKQFHQMVEVSGIALTKLDGTAKGGVIFAIAEALKLPIRFIGVGEQAEDLRPFAAEAFVDALLGQDERKA
ncbi:MAG: signal recognition particle-docking protein FtsY [Gammaproteobacteria bacterium]